MANHERQPIDSQASSSPSQNPKNGICGSASCCALRAKDMAEAFKKSPDAETAANLASRMVIETSELAKRRKVSTNAGLISIWKELDERWRAFARRCPEIKPDGFRIALEAVIPDSTLLKWY